MIFQSIFFFVNDFISLLIIRECFRNVWDEYIQPNHNKIKTLAIICSDSRKIVILFSFNAGGKCFAACALVFSYILNEFIMRFFFQRATYNVPNFLQKTHSKSPISCWIERFSDIKSIFATVSCVKQIFSRFGLIFSFQRIC